MKAIGTNNTWFKFKGIKNDDLGVRMLSMPTRPHPARKGRVVDIPGADSEMWQDEGGYKRIIVPIRLITQDNANIDDVNAWLSGEGDLIFGDEPNRAYHARITKEFSRSNRSQRLRGQEFTVSFDCDPFRYQATPVENITITASESSITNPGTVASLPLLKVEGNGEGTLMIGRNTLLFDAIPAPIYVDCAAKVAYTGTGEVNDPLLLATQYVTGEWVRIEPGDNFVTFTGGVKKITIVPRWRWL